MADETDVWGARGLAAHPTSSELWTVAESGKGTDLATVGWPGKAPSGKVVYRFDARRDWSVYTGTVGDVVFDGRVDLNRFRWPLSESLALIAPGRRVELRARIPSLDPATLPDVEDLALNVEGMGTLSGRVAFSKGDGSGSSGQRGVFEKGQLRLAIDSVPRWFEGLNFLPDWKKEGEVILENARVSVPLDDVKGLTYQARVALPELKLGIPGAGELPAIKLQADVSGSLKGAKIGGGEAKFGEIGSLVFQSEAGWKDLSGAWLELLKAVDVRSFDLDLGALLQTEVGRRLVTGRIGKGKAPTLDELPFVASGRLRARDLKATTKVDGDLTSVSLAGVEARDLEIQRTPLPVDLAGIKLNGGLSGEVRAAGTQARAVRLSGDVTGVGTQPLVARFGLRMDAGESGKLGLSGADVPLLKVPLAGLLDVFGLSKYLKCSGDLTVTDASYDATEGSASGLIRFEKLNAQQKGVAVEDLTGQARVTFKDGKIKRTHNFFNDRNLAD